MLSASITHMNYVYMMNETEGTERLRELGGCKEIGRVRVRRAYFGG
jgi:hypothetical protein